MEKETVYEPYKKWKKYKIIEKKDGKYLKLYDYLLRIDESNYIPKAGLLFEDILIDKCQNKKILDLGCGQLGILGLIALHYGADNVYSVDVDSRCIKWLNQIIIDNNIKNMKTKESDMFSNIKENESFDLILSNPPHMPMINGKACDSGGKDGKKFIKEILNNSLNHLNNNGSVIMMMFDFLGLDESFNDEISIFQYAKDCGYNDCNIIYEFEKFILPGSVTYQNLNYIKNIYPKYNFGDINPKCNIVICEFEK